MDDIPEETPGLVTVLDRLHVTQETVKQTRFTLRLFVAVCGVAALLFAAVAVGLWWEADARDADNRQSRVELCEQGNEAREGAAKLGHTFRDALVGATENESRTPEEQAKRERQIKAFDELLQPAFNDLRPVDCQEVVDGDGAAGFDPHRAVLIDLG